MVQKHRNQHRHTPHKLEFSTELPQNTSPKCSYKFPDITRLIETYKIQNRSLESVNKFLEAVINSVFTLTFAYL